jgi:hypothetical protein
MRQGGERQARAGRKIARQQEQLFAPHIPGFADPCVAVAAQRQDECHWCPESARERAHDARAHGCIEQLRIADIDVDRQPAFFEQEVDRIFVSRLHARRRDAEFGGDTFGEAPRIIGGHVCARILACDQARVGPQRLAVAPPVEREGPARRGFARIPLAEPVMRQALRREALAQAADQRVGARALLLPERRGGPFGRLIVVGRYECRFTPHREPHVAGNKIAIDRFAERVERGPGLVGERARHTRCFIHARDAHFEKELRLRRLDRTAERRGRAIVRRRDQRDVAFAGQQPGGRVEPDPARAGNEHLGPGMQVGAVLLDAVGRRHVRLQLDQIARHEARRQAEMAQRLHQQPGAVAAGAGAGVERFLRRARAGLHPHRVTHRALHAIVEIGQERHSADRPARHLGHEGAQPGPERLEVEIAAELVRELARQGERIGDRIGLDEEVERVERCEFGVQVDRDGELERLFREGAARYPVAVRVVLPVYVMRGRRDLHRVGRDARARVRRRMQADHLRPECDGALIGVTRDVVQADEDRHVDRLAGWPTGRKRIAVPPCNFRASSSPQPAARRALERSCRR